MAVRADSVRALAEKADIDPDTLESTVETYNEAVRTGDDPLGREFLPEPIETPPFYAVCTHDSTLVTFGGLEVTEDLQVVDTDGEPIPNLYAAGQAIGAATTSGANFAGGMLVTPALSFGRLLARELAPPSA